MSSDSVQAFVPGHVTGFFTIENDDDPTKAGSRGGGIAISDGVTVTVEPSQDPAIELNGEACEIEAVETVLKTLEAGANVRAETELPLGSGFGISGAMALGTALATNELFDRRLSENELLTIAHGADVQANTGRGDVVAQARGGVPIRLEPGGPQHNLIDAIPARAEIEYLTLGELSTTDVLTGETDLITTAGRRALSSVVKEPTLDTFVDASRKFAREAELLTDDVRRVISDVNEVSGDASMAMLGKTIFSVGPGLSEAGYNPVSCEVHHAGAHLSD
jgi:pantoate kinase